MIYKFANLYLNSKNGIHQILFLVVDKRDKRKIKIVFCLLTY